jgi:hypothetical protein
LTFSLVVSKPCNAKVVNIIVDGLLVYSVRLGLRLGYI